MPNEAGSVRKGKNQGFIKEDTLLSVFNKLNRIMVLFYLLC